MFVLHYTHLECRRGTAMGHGFVITECVQDFKTVSETIDRIDENMETTHIADLPS